MIQQAPSDLLGSMVKRYREQDLQLSQADLAWLADVSRGTISNLETGRVSLDERTWHKVRTALALARTSPEELRRSGQTKPVMPTGAVQGILQAILTIRSRDPEVGQRTAERWRHLVSAITFDDAGPGPEANSELAWLARDVALMAPPERLPVIHGALRSWGWISEGEHSQADPISTLPNNLEKVQSLIDTLTSSVNHMASQLRIVGDGAQKFERLPVRVQDLLARGLVADYDIDRLDAAPGVAIIDLVVVDEDESMLASRREVLEATRRWSAILMVTRYIFENMAPDRDPQDIVSAVEYALRVQGETEVDRLRQQARRGDPAVMYDLGKLLMKTGRTDEAEHWLRRAAEAGHPGALFNLGRLLQEGGRTDEAEHWLHKAAEAGHPGALFNLGRLLQERGRTDDAEHWLHRAAQAGHSGAISRLELTLYKESQVGSSPRDTTVEAD